MSKREKNPMVKVSSLGSLTGSRVNAFSRDLLNRTAATLWRPDGELLKADDPQLLAMMASFAAFRPADEIEGMIAAQAVALNAASMECLRRAMIPDQPAEYQGQMLKHGANLARAFTDMLDAVDRKRGKNRKQVFRVERVTVQAGGQAIVGSITSGPGGEGAHGAKAEGQPHGTPARLAHDVAVGTVLPALRRQEPGREAVPIAGNAREGPVQDARRRQHRGADG